MIFENLFSPFLEKKILCSKSHLQSHLAAFRHCRPLLSYRTIKHSTYECAKKHTITYRCPIEIHLETLKYLMGILWVFKWAAHTCVFLAMAKAGMNQQPMEYGRPFRMEGQISTIKNRARSQRHLLRDVGMAFHNSHLVGYSRVGCPQTPGGGRKSPGQRAEHFISKSTFFTVSKILIPLFSDNKIVFNNILKTSLETEMKAKDKPCRSSASG